MKLPDLEKRKHIGKILLAYSGTGWVIIQVLNFIVSQYKWSESILDAFILLFVFGLPTAFIYALYGNILTSKLKLTYGTNVFLAITIVGYYFIKPDNIFTEQIDFLKFKDYQKEIAQKIQSVAIRPFKNYTGDSLNDYLSYAIPDALITHLGSNSSLRVISKTSSLSESLNDESLQSIASKLKADAIIEGSLLSFDNKIKVNVSLINAFPEELQLWAKDFEGSREDILNIYSKITQQLSSQIGISVEGENKSGSKQVKIVDPKAYEAYQKGKVSFSFLTPQSIPTAENYFIEATQIDPEFGPAYAGLAGVWIAYKQLGFKPPDSTDSKIDFYLNRSFELDSLEAYAWCMHGANLGYKYDWNGRFKALEKSIEINPSFAEAHAVLAHSLMFLNKWNDAWNHIDKALKLDPFNPLVNAFYQVMLMHDGKIDPSQVDVYTDLMVNFKLKNEDAAIFNLKDILKNYDPEGFDKFIDDNYNEFGLQKTINLTAEKLVSISDSLFVRPSNIVSLYIAADNVEQSLFWLERMYFRKDPNLPYFAIKGPLNKKWLIENPRYKELMKLINLN